LLVLLREGSLASLGRTAQVRTVDLRKSKRYRLRAFVAFSAEQPDGIVIRNEGYTRDISPSGVFVLTGASLPAGLTVKLEITLPSLRGEHTGACLRTVGHVVRSEEVGFAAVADLGFRMQFPDSRTEDAARKESGSNGGIHEASNSPQRSERPVLASRFCM
jgi:hypothetical protein